MNIRDCKIILASASPRRRELLAQVGVDFEVLVSDCDEIVREKEPDKIVMQLSYDKASEVAARVKAEGLRESESENVSAPIIIGADTVVVSNGSILGKPSDWQDAYRMIHGFQGGSHYVYTGVTLIYGDKCRRFAERTRVDVCAMSDEEIWEYIWLGECMDKAGAYGIQGRFAEYVSGIDGDYCNVVGLPVSRLMRELKRLLTEA